MKRVVSMLLALTLLAGTLPTAFAANSAKAAQEQTVTVQELPKDSRLQDSLEEKSRSDAEVIDQDEIVTMIVEMTAPALMDNYHNTLSSLPSDMTAGEALADYLSAPGSVVQEEALLAEQDAVYNQICALEEMQTLTADAAPEAQWTTIFNGMAVRAPYHLLNEIRKIPGVKNVFVERVYDRPEPIQIGQDQDSIYGYSYDMVGLGDAWGAGYTGQGMLVAVLDSGLDINYNGTTVDSVHEAFTDNSFYSAEADRQLRYTNDSMHILLGATQLHANTDENGGKVDYPNNALYKNNKVPFAYDYVGSGLMGIVEGDLNVRPTTNDHGTHVCGTIAGYAKDKEGKVIFSGVAPDAQLMMMKVFPDENGGAPETVLLNALEDSMKLGADVVNLSLGSDNGFSHDDSARTSIYQRLNNAGILVMAAAGNSGASTTHNNYNEKAPVTDPEISMVSSPAVYDHNLAVASINNTVNTQMILTWTGEDGVEHEAAFTDPRETQMKAVFGGKDPVEVVAVDGFGDYHDYMKAGFDDGYGSGSKTGIALVKRGEISFKDKVVNAQFLKGVKAVVVYDNDPSGTTLINMGMDDEVTLPSAFISGVDGAALLNACKSGKVTLTVQTQDKMISAKDGGQLSSFTSWGAAPGLELKPEITAPGGNIWSSILNHNAAPGADYTGSYGMMSGTSMATPHMSGLSALVEQYVRNELKQSDKELASYLTNHLLVSTAVPQKDTTGTYYSPRLQGAGLVNVGAAIRTPAYIAVDGKLVGKLELKDDPQWTGSYDLNFRVENLTSDTLTYKARAVVLTPAAADGFMESRDTELTTVDLGTITVPASGTTVSKKITLTADQISTLKTTFPNGTYVEGFVILEDPSGVHPQIGLPYLAFLGDWTAAPIFDTAKWTDAPADNDSVWNNPSTWGISFMNSANLVEGTPLWSLTLGQNVFDPASDKQTVFHNENIALSPNGDGIFDEINAPTLFQIRNAKLLVVEVKDKNTGDLYYRDYVGNCFKTTYDFNYQAPIPATWYMYTPTFWGGTDLQGNVLPDGTQCVYTVTAFNDGQYSQIFDDDMNSFITNYDAVIPGESEPTFNGHAMDKRGDVFSFDVTIDTEAPTLDNSAVRIYEENGRTYVTGSFHDEHGALASVEVLPLVEFTPLHSDKPSYMDTDSNHPFYVDHIYDAATKTVTFTADVTEYTGTSTSDMDVRWTGTVYIYGGDYAGNDRGYAVEINADEGIILSHSMNHLYVGESFDLLVNNNVEGESVLTRTSDRPEVASIDEFGHVEALTPGQAVLTVSNGHNSAVCVVAVEERPAKLTDFQLTPSRFIGMKPDSVLDVQITDIEPSNVDISKLETNIHVTCPTQEYADLIGWDADGLSILINLASSTAEPKKGSTCTIEVTIDGITRTAEISWEDLYDVQNQEDLVPDHGYSQITYVHQGETAPLVAKYNNDTAHKFAPVTLYTVEGYGDYGDVMSQDPGRGLLLDGPGFCPIFGEWSGKLVNQEGYALPENIRIFERYEVEGTPYETEKRNTPYQTRFTYDSTTGEITIPNSVAAMNSTLVIRADGVEAPGNPAGELSGTEYPVPDLLYGPFEWTLLDGSGTIETREDVEDEEFKRVNAAYFTPDNPGVHTIQAASKDGKYTLNFTVVSLPVQASTITLNADSMIVPVGGTKTITATLDPVPSIPADGTILWSSFNEDIATVDADGTVTGISEGYAYIQAVTAGDAQVRTGCVVRVTPATDPTPDPDPNPNPKPDPDIPPYIPPHVPTVPDSKPHAPDSTIHFVDVGPDHWAYDSISHMVSSGAINGVSADHFAPNANMTRAMLVTVLWRMEGEPFTAYSGRFDDVADGQWYTTAVEWAAANHVVNGVGSGFAPDDYVTREQIAAILWRLSGSPKVSANLLQFTDGASVSSYAEPAMGWAVKNQLFRGNDAGMLRPGDTASRAETVTLLDRFSKLH